MYDITCPKCQRRYLMSTDDMLSMHHTSNGPIAYVRCPRGHHVVKEFGRMGSSKSGRTNPLKLVA